MNKKMKKVTLYTMALLTTGLVSCNQDFETIFSPQTNAQESLLQVSDVTVANTTPATINLADYFDLAAGTTKAIPIGTATVKEGAMPANTILKAEVEFATDADFNNSITVDANSMINTSEISINPQTLEDAYFDNITRNPATTDLYIRTVLSTVTGGTAEAFVGEPGKNYYTQSKVQFTPLNKVQISPAYYVIGAGAGWSADGARTQKFNHSDADVYEDPIFTIVVDAGGDDAWFAIGDDAALNAIANDNDWTKLLGTKGASEDLTGTMDFRYNLGGDHSFHVQGAKKLRITLDMLNYSYTIEPVNIADAYYLIGGPGEWNAESAKTMQFSHSTKDVFDDPVFTYTFAGSGSDMWFAIGDMESLDGMAAGDWSKVFGTKSGNGNSGESGQLSRRSGLTDEGSFKVDGLAKFYRVSINMSDMTYEIKALNFAQYIWQAGNGNGWGSPAAPLYSSEGDGKYTGFMYLDGEFKFRSGEDNWNAPDWGTGGSEGTLAEQAGNLSAPAGYYKVEADLAAMTYALTPITTIGIVGPAQAGGWSDDTDMTYNKDTGAWEATIELAADELKFRANDGWDINWGGDDVDNLTQGGPNLKIAEAGTYFVQLFALCDTKAYCKITKK
jgi:hypothetical protein